MRHCHFELCIAPVLVRYKYRTDASRITRPPSTSKVKGFKEGHRLIRTWDLGLVKSGLGTGTWDLGLTWIVLFQIQIVQFSRVTFTEDE